MGLNRLKSRCPRVVFLPESLQKAISFPFPVSRDFLPSDRDSSASFISEDPYDYLALNQIILINLFISRSSD